jgi:hypothetical protein
LRFVNCVSGTVADTAKPFDIERASVVRVMRLDLSAAVCALLRPCAAVLALGRADQRSSRERISDGTMGGFALWVGSIVGSASLTLGVCVPVVVAPRRRSVLRRCLRGPALLGDAGVFASLADRSPPVLDSALDVVVGEGLGLPAGSARLHGGEATTFSRTGPP